MQTSTNLAGGRQGFAKQGTHLPEEDPTIED